MTFGQVVSLFDPGHLNPKLNQQFLLWLIRGQCFLSKMAGTSGTLDVNALSSAPGQLSILSFNMHGFNQGCTALQDLCESNEYDVIFIQEHWVSPCLMNKILNISNKYVGFGISAMEAAVPIRLLRGRPRGGAAVLIKEKLASLCTDIITFERVVSVRISDMLLINSYMPCDDSSDEALNNLNEVLANICNIIEDSTAQYYIFGCDLNVNLQGQSAHSLAINEFLKMYHMNLASAADPGAMQIDYTFANEKLNHY